jgi:TonB family protein
MIDPTRIAGYKNFVRLALAACLVTAPMAWGSLAAGVDAYNGGDYALALHELSPLAEHGNTEAQKYLGAMYANGQGVPQNETTAVFWYLHAAISGDADAQIKLGDMYSMGKGVPADDALAVYWKWRAANILVDAARANLDASLQKSADNAAQKPAKQAAVANHCSPPPYRHDAEHFGEAGTVEVAFLVDPNGRALQAAILASSDWPRLDRLAKESYGSCTFSAAKNEGMTVPGVARMFYEWNPK